MFGMGERLSSTELYDAVLAIVGEIDDRERYIQETLIPKMDKRRGRSQPQTREDIVKKLFSADMSKPGEVVETIEESVRAKGKLTPEIALEVADVVYYTLQPNCPEWARNRALLITQGLEINIETAYMFCIVKYETRLIYGDFPDYKEVEKRTMVRFLANLSKLKANSQC